MVKVKWLKSHPSFGHFAGQTGEISAEWAEKLLGKFIMLVPGTDEDAPSPASPASPPRGGENPPALTGNENTLPEDMPGRDKLFEAGYKTLEAVKGIPDPLDVGISKTINTKLQKYLKGK